VVARKKPSKFAFGGCLCPVLLRDKFLAGNALLGLFGQARGGEISASQRHFQKQIKTMKGGEYIND